MKPRVLVVDDDPLIRDAICREASSMFDVETAESGEAGLETLSSRGPFALVVVDYRMPGMNGVAFLGRARRIAPDTVRVIVTGTGDMEAAVAAVNEGHVFRFVTRPCPAATLRRVLLVRSETAPAARRPSATCSSRRSAGAVRVLTEVLGLVSPDAFGRATRVKACVQHLVGQLSLPDAWQYEVAAMLSQIGCITLPADTLAKTLGGQGLTALERDLVRGGAARGRQRSSPTSRGSAPCRGWSRRSRRRCCRRPPTRRPSGRCRPTRSGRGSSASRSPSTST